MTKTNDNIKGNETPLYYVTVNQIKPNENVVYYDTAEEMEKEVTEDQFKKMMVMTISLGSDWEL